MWQLIGNIYKKDKDLSKNLSEIKELLRTGFLKNMNEPLSYSIADLIKVMQNKYNYKDCNLTTILKAIEEIGNEENDGKKSFNVSITEIRFSIDDIPF